MEEILHHPGCIKPYEYINWCMISSINSISNSSNRPNRLPLSKVTKHSLTQWIAPLIGVDQEDRKAEFDFFGVFMLLFPRQVVELLFFHVMMNKKVPRISYAIFL